MGERKKILEDRGVRKTAVEQGAKRKAGGGQGWVSKGDRSKFYGRTKQKKPD